LIATEDTAARRSALSDGFGKPVQINEGSPYLLYKAVYRNGTIEALQAKTLYNNKCASCQCDTSAGAPIIEVCNLDRKDLVLKRLLILNNYFDRIQAILRDLLAKKSQIKHFNTV
jgi:hypothetical protein